MRPILHILTNPEDSLARRIIEAQRQLPQTEVRVVDLSAPNADYRALLEEIFRADSVEVW